MFRAIGVNHGVHLFLNRNPLEEGLEYLTEAIRHGHGPAGLNMEMIEFRSERHYSQFIHSLTAATYLSVLNMAGSSPTLHASGLCSEETTSAFENFFANNKSVRSLDISGFSGKLDEGQLGKGFGHSLVGLTKNTTMTHLRVRNQNLHEDTGTLGIVISENKSIRTFDCQDNRLNLTSLQFLVSSLKNNHTIVDFPFSPEERRRIWEEILAGFRRQAPTTPSKKEKSPLHGQEMMLREIFSQKFEELQQCLRRNRDIWETTIGLIFDYESPGDSGDEAGWSELALIARQSEKSPDDDATPTGLGDTGARRPATVRSSNISINTSIPAPYKVPAADGAESPTDTLGHASELSTTPELVSPSTPEDLAFHKILDGIKASGLL